MENKRIMKLTTSQVKCFKTCRKRYELEYIECLKPIETPKALEIGTLYHEGLEAILTGKNIAEVEKIIISKQQKNAVKHGIDYEPLNALVAVEMCRAWEHQSGYKNWIITGVEKKFEVSTGYAKRLMGKIDGTIIRPETGKPYLIEHKTTSQWGQDGSTYLHNLLWDEQSTNYLYAYRKMLEDGTLTGCNVDGIFYDIIEKPTIKPYKATPLAERKYTKDGKLYAKQHEHDETPEAFQLRVREWYNEAQRVHTAFIYRTETDIAAQIEDYNLTLKDIATAEREGTFYRNPEACKILPCPYRAKCLDNVPDTDCLFIKKENRNEELA